MPATVKGETTVVSTESCGESGGARASLASPWATSLQRPAESDRNAPVKQTHDREQFRRHLTEFAEEGRPRHAVICAAAGQRHLNGSSACRKGGTHMGRDGTSVPDRACSANWKGLVACWNFSALFGVCFRNQATQHIACGAPICFVQGGEALQCQRPPRSRTRGKTAGNRRSFVEAGGGKDLAEQGLVAINIGGAGEGKTKETGTEGSGGREGEQGPACDAKSGALVLALVPARSATSIERGNQGGIDSKLRAAPERESICDDLDAAIIEAIGVDVEVAHKNMAGNNNPSLSAHTGSSTLEREPTGAQDARTGASSAVVTERVDRTAAATSCSVERQGQAKPAEQQSTENRRVQGELVAGRQGGEDPRGGEVGCWRVLSRTAETKSAMAQGQVGARGRGLGQGIGLAGHNVKQLGEAAQNVAVMFGSEHSCECREQLEESTVLHGKVLELRSDVLVRSQGLPRTRTDGVRGATTRKRGGQGKWSHRCRREKPARALRDHIEDPAKSLVCQEDVEARSQVTIGAERRRKCKREQGGHERVALLATFTLRHEVGDAFIICPHKRRRRAIEQADEGEHGGGLRRVSELGEHGLAAYEVKCTNAINGKDSAAGVSIGLELEAVGESLSPCRRGQGELVGAGGFINVAAVLLGKCAGNQTAEEVHGRLRLVCAVQRGVQGRVLKQWRVGGVGIVEEQTRDVGCKSSGAGGSTSAGATQIAEQGRRRQSDRCFGEPGQEGRVDRRIWLAGATVRVSQLLESGLVA
ncbi:hypothetical protein AK812_SmicGene30691 [Symbiodinium microadriaticum]|uniref:Uncharacterized protein n=1 Tax=Symbiodinium microadriaticum TaxID=2951 RepID=A0A1Q9CYM0_SYMMI|nr:hypothetical protein AK812_SmicGene30691 [Symbiodinium microadriaticum]